MEGAQLLMRYDEAMHPLVASLQQLSSDELLGLLKRLNLSYEQLSDVIQGVSPEKNSLVDAILDGRSSETGSSTVHAAELEPEAAPPEVAPTAAAPEATAAAAPEATPEVTPNPPAEADPATAPEVTGAADAASAAPETSLVATPLKAIAALLSRFSCRAIVAILLYVSTAELGLKDYTKYSTKNLSMLDEFAPPPPPPSVGITTLVAAIVASYVAGAVSDSAATTVVASFVGGAVSVLAFQRFLGRGPLSSRRAKTQ